MEKVVEMGTREENMDSPEEIMWKLLQHSQQEQCLWRPTLVCPECCCIPLQPITAPCGHTWCADCAHNGTRCVCGAAAPINGVTDIALRDLINAMFAKQRDAAADHRRANMLLSYDNRSAALEICETGLQSDPRNIQLRLIRARIYFRNKDYYAAELEVKEAHKIEARCFEAHYMLAIVYKKQNHYEEAIKYFYASWLLGKPLGIIRASIVEIIEKLFTEDINHSDLMSKICSSIRCIMQECANHSSESVLFPKKINPSELMCTICCQYFVKPVATPCGHTFCRSCVDRCLDHNRGCPFCNAPIDCMRNILEFKETAFFMALVARFPVEYISRPPQHRDMLPLMVCTIGFPYVSCPLLIKEGRYKHMIRLCIQSGSHQFGMVSCKPSPRGSEQAVRYSEYGTLLQIKDCVTMEDGCLILSTVGVTRFRIMHCEEVDGYDVARTEPVHDEPIDNTYEELQRLNYTVHNKALMWGYRMNQRFRYDIEHSYGQMPSEKIQWQQDGPAWVWWLLAALPVTVELKRMLLGTTTLVLRLRAIDKTLDLRKWSIDYESKWHDESERIDAPVSHNVERWLVSPGELDYGRRSAL